MTGQLAGRRTQAAVMRGVPPEFMIGIIPGSIQHEDLQ